MRIVLITQHNNQDIFIQYHEGFNFVTGKPSQELKGVHLTAPIKAPSITLYTKSDSPNGYVIPQEPPLSRKSEKKQTFP